MKRTKAIVLAMVITVFACGSTFAAPKAINPNGFPNGPHYNLNIIGKKADFTCPEPTLDEYGNIVYGNVIYVPQDGTNIQILMQSGKKGGKADNISELRVIDACAGMDGNGALLELPPNESGYEVYARALAKPTDNPSITIQPQLIAVEDENGSDLFYFGLVTKDGFETPTTSFIRKKGKSTAVDITGLFNWSGSVCYFTQPETYEESLYLCCIDEDLNGAYEECEEPTVDETTGSSCPAGYELEQAYCTEYTNSWIFNIADFVTYLWNTENNGVKLLQVRFYPVLQ